MMSEFADLSGKIYTIAPSADFFALVARELVGRTLGDTGPEALAEAMIFTPNQRSAQDFGKSLLACAGREAIILPQITALGELDKEALLSPAECQGDKRLEFPAPKPAQRRGVLARLVQAWREAQGLAGLSLVQALAVADELIELLDQAGQQAKLDWAGLEDAVIESDLAEHWRLNADFLRIIAEHWPRWLDDSGYSDRTVRQHACALALAKRWQSRQPAYPVWLIGSTGATAPGRILMQAIAQLEHGAVILPGLDMSAKAEDWERIKSSPTHPQYALGRALDWLGVAPESVKPWPGSEPENDALARIRLLNEALAPAAATCDWRQRLLASAGQENIADFTRRALDGLSLIEGKDEAETAHIAALILRKALHDEKTAALVTPDAELARRVSSLLRHWQIEVTPSAGTPLFQTKAGSFIALLLHWLLAPGDPALVLALLKHDLFRCGRDKKDLRQTIKIIELNCLRGAPRHAGPGALAKALQETPHPDAKAISLMQELQALLEQHDSPDSTAGMADKLAALAEALAAPASPWRYDDGRAAAKLLEQFADLIAAYKGTIAADELPHLLGVLAGNIMVPGRSTHSRLAIWGPLEARLQHRDLIILGGLNEGIWPRHASEGLMPPRLRSDFGLPDPEQRIGLSAHDFAQIAAKPETILLRTRRDSEQVTIASRWIWRLKALARSGLEQEEADRLIYATEPQAWAEALLTPEQYSPAEQPRPCPPAAARPRIYSVTQAERLATDPYHVYARQILKLRPLLPVKALFGPLERGIAIHAALEELETLDDKTPQALLELIEQKLLARGMAKSSFGLSRPAWLRAAMDYIDWRHRRPSREIFSEIEGQINLDKAGIEVILRARADRIEKLDDGSFAIIDFKTGSPPKESHVLDGHAPQLALEAAILRRSGFTASDGHRIGGETSALIYYRFSDGKPDTLAKLGKPLKIDDIAAETERLLQEFLDRVIAYADPGQPFCSRPDPGIARYPSDYDRLARRAEWVCETLGEDDAR